MGRLEASTRNPLPDVFSFRAQRLPDRLLGSRKQLLAQVSVGPDIGEPRYNLVFDSEPEAVVVEPDPTGLPV